MPDATPTPQPAVKVETRPAAPGRLSLKAMLLSLLFIALGLGGMAAYIWITPIYAQERFLKELEGKGVTFDRPIKDSDDLSGWIRGVLEIEPPPSSYDGPMVIIARDRLADLRSLANLERIFFRERGDARDDDSCWWVATCGKLQSLWIEVPIKNGGLGDLRGLSHLEHLRLDARDIDEKFLSLLPADRITNLELTSAKAGPAWAARLAEFSSLKEIDLSDSDLDAAAMRAILEKTPVQELNITRSKVRWPDFTEPSASGVRVIWSRNSDVDRRGFKAISRLPKLAVLALLECRLDAAGLAELAGMRNLGVLYVSGSNIDDEALRMIGRIENLTELGLDRTMITSRGLAQLIGLSSLSMLSVDQTAIDDLAAEHLIQMPGLRALSISDTALGDQGFGLLVAGGKLTSLSVAKTHLTVRGLEAMFQKRSLEILNLDDSIVSQATRAKILLANPDLAGQVFRQSP